MTFSRPRTRRRKPRPASNQPGTLRQQIDSINRYLDLPEYFREHDPQGAQAIARWHALPHVRQREAESCQVDTNRHIGTEG